MFNDVTGPMYHAEWSLGEGGEVVRGKRRGREEWKGGIESFALRGFPRAEMCGDAIKK